MGKSLVSKPEKGVVPVGFDVSPGEVVHCPPSANYAFFVSNKGRTFAKVSQQIPAIQDGSAVLCEGSNYSHLNPFRFYLIQALQHWSMLDGEGKITKTTFDAGEAKEDKALWKEHVETLLIVLTPDDRLVPATCTFKTTKCNAAHTAIEAIHLAEDLTAWGKKSPEHKVSLIAPLAYARVLTTVTLKRGTSRAGYAFVAADAFVRPTGLSDWQLLSESFASDAFQRLCYDARNRFLERIETIKRGA